MTASYQTDEFEIKFGKTARTIQYKDLKGEIIFTFDFNANREIEVEPSHGPNGQELRYKTAFERTIEFVKSCGYQAKAATNQPFEKNTLFEVLAKSDAIFSFVSDKTVVVTNAADRVLSSSKRQILFLTISLTIVFLVFFLL